MNLPDGYRWKKLTDADAPAIAHMVNRSSEVFSGGVSFTDAEIVTELKESQASWGIQTTEGVLVAYNLLWVNEQRAIFELDGVVHPDYIGQGLGSALVQIAGQNIRSRWNAMKRADVSPQINVQVNGRDDNAIQLFTDKGFSRLKQDLVMEIQLSQPPAPAVWKDGFGVREFVPGQDDQAVFEVLNASFQSIAGYSERSISFEDWQGFSVKRTGFDPGLWFLATTGDQIAGICLCPHDKGVGWIRNIGVHPDFQGNGLGVALIQHAFGVWYDRGYPIIQLAVQGDNMAAINLYEKVGMSAVSVYETFVKPLA